MDYLVYFDTKTSKMQSEVNAFKFIEGQMLWQIIIAVIKLMREETHQSLHRIDRDIVLCWSLSGLLLKHWEF